MSALHSRVISATATALLLGAVLTTAAVPAAARPEAGPALEREPTSTSCPLERVGTQFVKCDDLTGNGVSAPGWVPEQ